MMRVLHTADWHAGKVLARSIHRLDELRAVLDEMAAFCEERDVHVVVVAGDLFDHKIPSPEAEAVVYNGLLDLARGRELILVAGNHDAPGHWRAIRPLMNRSGIHVAADIMGPEDGGHVYIDAANGHAGGQFVLMPWLHARQVTSGEHLMLDEGKVQTAYAERLADMARALTDGLDIGKSRVIVGHMMVEKALLGGGERTATLAGMYPISSDRLPSVDYIALGHIHRPQRLRGGPTLEGRYSGSVMQLDFGETKWEPSVCLVELEPGMPTVVSEHTIKAGRRLVVVEGDIDRVMAHDDTGDAWIKAVIHGQTLNDSQMRMLEERYLNLAAVGYKRPVGKEIEGAGEDIAAMGVGEQLAGFWKAKYGTEMDKGDVDLFESLLAEEVL